jgi:glucans biosynthesis protein C
MARAYYIDNLRILLTLLVVVHHTAIGYGASGGWCYVTPDTIKGTAQMLLSVMLTINQAFFMSLFFFISAYLMPGSLERKGVSRFLKDRLLRLGIPLLLTMLLINPSLLFGISKYTQSTSMNWPEYVWMCITRYPNTSHMWFVLALLIFESIYSLYKKYSRSSISWLISVKKPSPVQLLLFIMTCGIVAFIVRLYYPIGGKNIIGLQLGYFTLYTAMYAMGIIAQRNQWMDKLTCRTAKPWFLLAIAVLPLIVLAWVDVTRNPETIVKYIGGAYWKSFFLAAWEAVVCVGFCYYLLMFFKRYLNHRNKFTGEMAANTYFVYFIHPVIVVGATILFEGIGFPPFGKFFLTCIVGISCCFTLALFVRRIPGIKSIF